VYAEFARHAKQIRSGTQGHAAANVQPQLDVLPIKSGILRHAAVTVWAPFSALTIRIGTPKLVLANAQRQKFYALSIRYGIKRYATVNAKP
jgi:hypothetical protein